MKAQEFLSQAYMLDKQIKAHLEQLEHLRSMTCAITASYGGEQVDHTRNVTALQNTIARIMEKEEELNREIDRLVDLKLQIGDAIDLVKNPVYHTILELRYLCFKTWSQIGKEMHYSSRWARTLHTRALNVLDRLLKDKDDARGQQA